MPYCPKCKNNQSVEVFMSVYGVLHVNENTNKWPEIQAGDYASPDTDARCTSCGYSALLEEFKIP